ncbi:MAG TPA: hypothetical protein VGJ44_09130, partial [Kribbellaceae bacterium]
YWGKEGPELLAWLEEKLAEDHVIVMGANTYRTMSQVGTGVLGVRESRGRRLWRKGGEFRELPV